MGAVAIVSQLLGILVPLAEKGIKVWGLYTETKKIIDENRVADDPEWDALSKRATEVEAIVFDKSRDVPLA